MPHTRIALDQHDLFGACFLEDPEHAGGVDGQLVCGDRARGVEDVRDPPRSDAAPAWQIEPVLDEASVWACPAHLATEQPVEADPELVAPIDLVGGDTDHLLVSRAEPAGTLGRCDSLADADIQIVLGLAALCGTERFTVWRGQIPHFAPLPRGSQRSHPGRRSAPAG